MDTGDIGSAIAARYASGTLSAPSGYIVMQASVYRRREGLGKTPFCITRFDGIRDVSLRSSSRIGVADFTTTFYYGQSGDMKEDDEGLQVWHDVLVDALLGEFQLGEGATANGVTVAYITAARLGYASLGSTEYAAIEMPTEVYFKHDITSSLAA